MTKDLAIVQDVSFVSLTANKRVRLQTETCEICGERSGIETQFALSMSISPGHIIPPLVHTQLYLRVALTRKTNV